MKRVGASTAATASADADSVGAASVGAGAADSVATGISGASMSSESEAGRVITTTANNAIAMIAAIKTRGDVPCLGAALGFDTELDLDAGALFVGVGIVVMFAREGLFTPPTGTGGTTNLLAEVAFFAVFLTTFLAAAFFLAGAFLAGAFLETFFTAAFLRAGAFLETFFTAAFFFAGAFLATFFTEAFFLTATLKLPLAISDHV